VSQEVQSRLYVVAVAGTDPPQVAGLLDAAGAATMLITPGGEGALTAAAARPLVELAQSKDVAALIEGDAQLARTLRADGVHLPWSNDVVASFTEAREILGTRYIVGVDVGRSRHDAMTLAEEGADYIAFGIPPHVEDRDTAKARRLELIAWWGEIFEIPCVAFDVDNAADAVALAAVGADFIALRRDVELTASDAKALARDLAEAAQQREALA
jgi:thiamine-phosphate pyrophosphorylase